MRESSVHSGWREPHLARAFEAGVCLHSHTMHSRECLSFLARCLRRVPGLSSVVGYYERGPRRIDLGRAWWTPPLSPASALRLEREQIAALGLRAMVSLTDHDDIQAGLALGIAADSRDTPLSVEWTVPYRRSIYFALIRALRTAPSAAGARDHFPRNRNTSSMIRMITTSSSRTKARA